MMRDSARDHPSLGHVSSPVASTIVFRILIFMLLAANIAEPKKTRRGSRYTAECAKVPVLAVARRLEIAWSAYLDSATG